MQNRYSSKGGHLTITERQLIEGWKKQWCYCQTFKKAPQTIHNDIKRGLITQKDVAEILKRCTKLTADYAQHPYNTNRKQSVKPVTYDKETQEKIKSCITLSRSSLLK